MSKQEWEKSWEQRFQEFEAQAAYNQPPNPELFDCAPEDYDGYVSGNSTATFEGGMGRLVPDEPLPFRLRVLIRIAKAILFVKTCMTREGREWLRAKRALKKLFR